MDMDYYQEKAATTAVYPRGVAMEYLLLKLAGEAGEAGEAYAKHLRGDYGAEIADDRVAAEIGDVLWYVAMIADELGLNLSTIARNNLGKLADRAARGVIKGDGDKR